MRAQPVPQDTIDLLITAAYTSTTLLRGPDGISPLPALLIANADRLGQHLWDENYASVTSAIGRRLTAPVYQWQPVAELLHARWTDEQVLQVERTRLYYAEVSCHHFQWDSSEARELVEQLSHVVEDKLRGYPISDCPEHAGVMEYSGLSRFAEEWTRLIGFRDNLAGTGAIAKAPGSRA